MVNKKTSGQLKIQQMAFMLMAVTVFFALVGMFLLTMKVAGLRSSAEELCEENARLLVSKLANSPEFSCGESFGGSKIACVDSDKVMMLKENILPYKGFWGVNNIEIRKIYPKGSKICDTANYPNCNIIRIRGNEVSGDYLENFVSLCRKGSFEGEPYNHCGLAKLMVSYEGEKC